MKNIKIRQCLQGDLIAIADICYKTGFMGEDLTGTEKFNDRTLFSYLFCLYYPLYEIDNCFIALDETKNMIVGYIIGTENTLEQEKRFIRKMIPKIILRICTHTIFFYPESFGTVLLFIKGLNVKDIENIVYKKYPAHLHMNILPEYQKRGIGTMLISVFEEHMKDKGVSGIHIWTSNKNVKAVPFYSKNGYEIIFERESRAWKSVEGYKDFIFGKKIT